MRRLAGLTAMAALALPGAAAPAVAETPYTPAQAEAQLEQAVAAVSETDPEAAHPTLELADLAQALPALDGRDRRQARAILARPPAGDSRFEPYGGEWTGPNVIEKTTEAAYPGADFIVHWPEDPDCAAPAQGCDEPDLADVAPANSVPDYIDQVVAAMEASRAVENGTLGWPEYKPDGTRGGDGRLDIYVADICNEDSGACVFGYASTEGDTGSPDECRVAPFKCSAFLVIDNDYNFDEFRYADPGEPMRVTTAHEYNHILQFNIDSAQEDWMLESTATWSEEQVFPADDDWVVSYIPPWAASSRQSLTNSNGGGGLRIYGSAVWNHWLQQGDNGDPAFGPDVILDAWELSRQTNPRDYAVGAYNAAIKANGGAGFSPEFVDFAAATSEWRTGDGNFPEAPNLVDVDREGKLKLNKRWGDTRLDNTTYELLRVNPRNFNRIKLKVIAARRTRSGIALVGRQGSATGGTVTRVTQFLNRGGTGRVVLRNAQDFDRITAAVVNADGRVRNGSYVRNGKRFRLKLR